MATAFRSSSFYANQQAAPGRLLPVTTGTVITDVTVVYANCWLNAAAAFTWTISGGNGSWIPLLTNDFAATDGQTYVKAWAKRATATDSGNYTIGGWTGSQWTEAVAVTISGIPTDVDLATAIQVHHLVQPSSGTAYPTLTVTVGSNDPALIWIGDSYDYDSDTPPTNFTERYDQGQCISAATRFPAAAGTYTTPSATHAGSTSGAATLITIPNAAGLTPVTKTVATEWNVRASVTKTTATAWNVLSTSTVSKTVAAEWNVRAGVTKTVDVRWRTLAIVTTPFVTDVSANGRYFIDQNSNPILVKGDSPWSATSDISTTDWDTYCSNRAGLGFNCMLMSVVGSTGNGGPNNNGTTFDGVAPFVGGNITNFNETYWSRIDTFLDIAESYGITIFLYMIDGWNILGGAAFNGKSNADCQTFGNLVATRFASRPNIVWMFGGDYNGGTTTDNQMKACLDGIRATGDTRPASCQMIYQRTWTSQYAFWDDIVDFDFVYSYPVQYDAVYAAYNAAPIIPSLWMEGHYGGENDGYNATNVKRQAGWAMTQGSPGHFYGSDDWEFHSGWASRLNTYFAPEVGALANNVEDIPRWWDLSPTRTFITSGAGTLLDASGVGQTGDPSVDPSQSTYATAAITSDGKVAVVYLPTQRAIQINSGVLASGATGTWIKADNAAVTGAAGSLSGSMTPPSSGDWLLVITAPDIVTKTVDTRWNVLSSATKTVETQWNVLSDVTKTADAQWNVRTAVARNVDSWWNVRTDLTKTADTQWNVRTDLTRTVDTQWNVRTGAVATVQTSWQIRSGVSKSVTSEWNVAADSGTTAVIKTVATSWNVMAGVTRAVPSAWMVRTGVVAEVSSTWMVRTAVLATTESLWGVTTAVVKTASSEWMIRTAVIVEIDSVWNVEPNGAFVALTAEVLGVPVGIWVHDGSDFVSITPYVWKTT